MSLRLIGDPHITRKFVMNVPLSRRGEREELLFHDFEKRLYEGDEEYLVMVGDLLERPVCSLADLYRIADIILAAARLQPNRLIILLAGNHDRSAQAGDYGAFDILKLFHQVYPNLFIFTEPAVIGDLGLFPWQWDRTALEQIEDMKGEEFSIAIGHWDLVAYDEMHKDHFCPAQELVAMGAKEIYSGHWHVAGDYVIDGITVHCTGSMQPMTHSEDPDGKMYVTLTLDEYQEADHSTFKNKYVRVILPRGENPDALSDCLGFKFVWENEEEITPEDVKVEEFKMADVLHKSLTKHEVNAEVSKFIKDRINVND
jgi:predicted phosphodiesterase